MKGLGYSVAYYIGWSAAAISLCPNPHSKSQDYQHFLFTQSTAQYLGLIFI